MCRFAEYDRKRGEIARNPPASIDEEWRLLNQYFEEAYGISHNSAFALLKIYIEENPEKEYLFGGWNVDSVGIAYIVVKLANLDATEEELLEHFRQAARDKTITIS